VSEDLSKDPALLHDFVVESEELLQAMDQDMVALEAAPDNAELLNRIFRALHTIKGTAGFMALDSIVKLSHRAEDVLNSLRRRDCRLTRRLMDALLAARDQLGAMLRDLRNQEVRDYPIDELLVELQEVQKPTERPLPLGELLVEDKVIPPEALQAALQEQARQSQPKKLGEILIEQGAVSRAQIGDALVRQKSASEASAQPRTMRVDVRKLDELINLVGELVLERNRLVRLSRDLAIGTLDHSAFEAAFALSTARLSFVTDELQNAGLKTRMVPIEVAFQRFPRLVRDLARAMGKQVQLVLGGQDTEIDKTMVEFIADPLVHLVRNSLDHGIELPEVREKAGKPRDGTIHLEASQKGDQIVIAITDDGAGINPEKVLSKALEKGLVTQERARSLSKREILDFIFLPGFSTAQNINNLSGRGVGMDVVRSNLRKLNGTIELESEVGQGIDCPSAPSAHAGHSPRTAGRGLGRNLCPTAALGARNGALGRWPGSLRGGQRGSAPAG
jgi:two-component system, chemotaxis family, sensor kinase CheA